MVGVGVWVGGGWPKLRSKIKANIEPNMKVQNKGQHGGQHEGPTLQFLLKNKATAALPRRYRGALPRRYRGTKKSDIFDH